MNELSRKIRNYEDDYNYYYDVGNNDTNTTENASYWYPEEDYEYPIIDSYFYKVYDFEEPVYLFLWIPMIILTTLTNILVLLVLKHRRMRSATNIILIAIAISDSMTGLVTVPGLIYAFEQRIMNDLKFTREWCSAFMLLRYFFSRSFHTISIWLTVVLGLQRLVSVSCPFRAQAIFSIRKTVIAILCVTILAPIVHIYHFFDSKANDDKYVSFCEWTFEKPCKETCAYFWLTVFLMHFLPCGLLLVFTFSMVGHMKDAERKMEESKMIANQKNIERRKMEGKRITCIVLVVVVVFLIPEVPFGLYLLVTAVYRQQSLVLVEKKTSREIICAYEILLVLTFQANFWIYVIMNRKFRRGLKRLLDPVLALINFTFSRVGMAPISRPRLDSTTTGSGGKVPATAMSNTLNSRLSVSHSFRMTGLENRRLSRTSSESNTGRLEMKTYSFLSNNNQVALHEMEKIESESEPQDTGNYNQDEESSSDRMHSPTFY